MANLRRRSARLSQANSTKSSTAKASTSNARLQSLTERQDTPDTVRQAIDGVLNTPTASRTTDAQLSQLRALRTPQTEPRPEQAEMDPKTAHRSTAKAPDSGLKLGFSDITTDKKFDTPSKSYSRLRTIAAPTFQFKLSADSQLSEDARKLMENVREDASRIKAQMLAERSSQEQKDRDAETMFGAGRKIAQPKGKAGRFSDIHMAQFKKMDSIENHASAFRAKPVPLAPTTRSLKRSPSKAELDNVERPRATRQRTATHSERISPPVIGRPNSTSPFKSIPVAQTRNNPGAAKRARQSEHHDVSDSRPLTTTQTKPSTLYSPTKSSLARTSKLATSPTKSSMIPRSNTLKQTESVRGIGEPSGNTKFPIKQSVDNPLSELPQSPTQRLQPIYPILPDSPSKSLSNTAKESSFTSKLPTLSGLRSILRGGRKTTAIADRPGTPKRPNSAGPGSDPAKKVDFTPSVKSRHAVKLAADSPSPAKIRRDTPYKSSAPVIAFDSSAYVIQEDEDQYWEDEDSEVTYPTLPPTEEVDPAAHTFQNKSREHSRRESKEFKSIFTNLHPTRMNQPTSLTSINTGVNKTNPEAHLNQAMKTLGDSNRNVQPPTIRRVRTSHPSQLVQPFEDRVNTIPRGTPGKKRRHDSMHGEEKHSGDEAKENRQLSSLAAIGDSWNDAVDDSAIESSSRAGKRVRMSTKEQTSGERSPVKKVSAAREAAAKNAKDRKSRGVLSLSRLNMLSRPKSRG